MPVVKRNRGREQARRRGEGERLCRVLANLIDDPEGGERGLLLGRAEGYRAGMFTPPDDELERLRAAVRDEAAKARERLDGDARALHVEGRTLAELRAAAEGSRQESARLAYRAQRLNELATRRGFLEGAVSDAT